MLWWMWFHWLDRVNRCEQTLSPGLSANSSNHKDWVNRSQAQLICPPICSFTPLSAPPPTWRSSARLELMSWLRHSLPFRHDYFFSYRLMPLWDHPLCLKNCLVSCGDTLAPSASFWSRSPCQELHKQRPYKLYIALRESRPDRV